MAFILSDSPGEDKPRRRWPVMEGLSILAEAAFGLFLIACLFWGFALLELIAGVR